MKLVKEILRKKGNFVATIDRDASCLKAVRDMNMRKIGSVVVKKEEKIVGIFTERDILVKLAANDWTPGTHTVEEIMSSPVAICRMDTTVEECRDVMTSKRIRHLPVIDEEGKLEGIISSGDILASEITHKEDTIEYLNQYIFGPYN